jgi:TusA-related sulfurtransferase
MNATKTIEADEVLDVRKRICPMPVLLTKKKIRKMKHGDILEVIGDYAQAAENIQRFAKRMGHSVLKVKKGPGKFDIFIKKRVSTFKS